MKRNGETVADIDMSWFRERAEVVIEDQIYVFARESMLQGTFALRQSDQVLASARKTSVFMRAFDVETEGRQLTLSAVSVWRREFGLYHDGIQIGCIYPRSWLGRTAVIDLPEELTLPTQVFLFWLVLVLWRRAANSKSHSH